jgi:hypothetical protein
MAETTTLIALFEDVDPAAEAIERLRSMGVKDEEMEVFSGVPVLERVLGRPKRHTNVGRLALGGAALGFLFGLFLNFGTPFLFPLRVGGQPLFPLPTGIILAFEMSMLGLMGTAFIAVFLESNFPIYKPLEYVPEVSDGKIAVLFKVPEDEQARYVSAMQAEGAESVAPAVARHL